MTDPIVKATYKAGVPVGADPAVNGEIILGGDDYFINNRLSANAAGQ